MHGGLQVCSPTSSSSGRASAAASRAVPTASLRLSRMPSGNHRRRISWMSVASGDPGRQRAVDGGDAGHPRRRLTQANFDHMIALATRFREGVEAVLDAHDVDWSIAQPGARAEYRFCRPAPRTGTESAAARRRIEEFLLPLPVEPRVLYHTFHNMALMCRRRPRPTWTCTAGCSEAVAHRLTPIGSQERVWLERALRSVFGDAALSALGRLAPATHWALLLRWVKAALPKLRPACGSAATPLSVPVAVPPRGASRVRSAR